MLRRDEDQLRREVKDHANRFPYLSEYHDPNIARHTINPTGRHRPDVLALRHRRMLETVRLVGLYAHLRPEPANRGCQRYDLDHGRSRVEDPLGGQHDSWMAEPSLSSPEVSIEPLDLGRSKRSGQFVADAILAQTPYGHRNRFADGRSHLGSESFQFLMRGHVDSNTRTLHASEYTASHTLREALHVLGLSTQCAPRRVDPASPAEPSTLPARQRSPPLQQ